MTRRGAICVFVVLLILAATAETAAAQRGGRAGFAGAPGRAGSASPSRITSGPTTTHVGGGPVVRPPIAPSRPPLDGHNGTFVMRPQHHVIIAPYWGYYGGFYGAYPYVWGPSYYSEPPYDPTYADPSYVAPASQSDANLAYEVQQLTREVEQLRQDQARLSLQLSPPQPRAPDPPVTPITLVFRDGRRMNIQNYAIVKQTLWVIDERMSTRIDLSDLDLDATQQANSGRFTLLPAPTR